MMQANTPLLSPQTSIASRDLAAAHASGSTDAPASPGPSTPGILQGARNRRVFDRSNPLSPEVPADRANTYCSFNGGLSVHGDVHRDIACASDARALNDIHVRHAEERDAQGRFAALRGGLLRAASVIGLVPRREEGDSAKAVRLTKYCPLLPSELPELPQSALAEAHASNTHVNEPLDVDAETNQPNPSTAADADSVSMTSESSDSSSETSDSSSDTSDTSSETSSAGSAAPLDGPDVAQSSSSITSSAQYRNQKVVRQTAQDAADTGDPPGSQFDISAQRHFFMTLLSPTNRDLVKHHPENNFDRGFHYLMPTLCALADDFGVDHAAIEVRANQFAHFSFRPEGDTLLGIIKPDLRTPIERRLHLPKANAARRTPDHLHAIKALMRLIDEKMKMNKLDSDEDASPEPANELAHPLITITDRLTWALMLTKHKLLSEVANHEQRVGGQATPAGPADLRALEKQFQDVKRLVAFTGNNRRSIISVMQQRAKLIHDGINFSDNRVHPRADTPPGVRDDDDDNDAAGGSPAESRMASPMHAPQQYRIPGWAFSQETTGRDAESNSDSDSAERTPNVENAVSVSRPAPDEPTGVPDADVFPDAEVLSETPAGRNRRRPYRAFADEASVDSSIRL